MHLPNLNVVPAAANQTEVGLVEVSRTRQLGSGNVGQGMKVKVVEQPVSERANEEEGKQVESQIREAIGLFRCRHV